MSTTVCCVLAGVWKAALMSLHSHSMKVIFRLDDLDVRVWSTEWVMFYTALLI